MGNRPDVSIFMPVKDGAAYLNAAVISILKQTHGKFELIIVDDGSTDATPDILALLAMKDDRIRIVTLEQNQGAAAASNRALEQATGEFAARFDADDLAEPDWLATSVAYLRQHPDIDIVGVSRRFIRPDGSLIREDPISEDAFQVDWIARFRWPFVHSGMMFRQDRGPNIPKPRYNPAYKVAHDFEFCDRYLVDSRGANLPDILVSYRVHGSALSRNHWNDQHQRGGEVVARAQERAFPSDIFSELAAFRLAYYGFKLQSGRKILAGLKAAVDHGPPTATKYRNWMCREAFRMYLVAMGRGGRRYPIAVVCGFLWAPGMAMTAIRQKVFGRFSVTSERPSDVG